jgi:uncharacterized Rossmann fold enzyme
MLHLQRLDGITVVTATDTGTISDNIRKNSELGLQDIFTLPEWREQMPIALVGGGPSLKDHIADLRRYERVMVCGSAHDYAVSQEIEPQWTVVCDPDPIVNSYIRQPVASCMYLVASSCDPSTFEHLKGHKVIIWHCGNVNLGTAIWGDKPKIVVGGGCTVGTRALMIALCFGYSNIHLFGFDNCVRNDEHHAYPFTEDDMTPTGDLKEVRFGTPDAPSYYMYGYMLGQFFDFSKILKQYGHRLNVTVHGGGPLDELVKFGAKNAEEK